MKGTMILNKEDISDILAQVMDQDKLKVMPAAYWKQFSDNKIKVFMVTKGVYVIPTQELIDWLRSNIVGRAIEIGAGVGSIGRALEIPTTDRKLMDRPDIRNLYQAMGQAPTIYPQDVEELTAHQAVLKYQPDTVIGAFITHKFKESIGEGNMYGVEEEKIIDRVRKYIMIGNRDTHKLKPILKKPHKQLWFDWLITRSNDQGENRIFVWQKFY